MDRRACRVLTLYSSMIPLDGAAEGKKPSRVE